jgi:hypothetical protein
MSATYQEITATEMKDFMNYIGFEEADPNHPCKETVYEAPYGEGFKIRIYSTIENGSGRGVGGDAIRVVCVNEEGQGFHSMKRVHRTQNWRKNVLERIDTIFDTMPMPKKCSCDNGILLPKKSKNGIFLGCSTYPSCKNTENLK